MNDGLKDKYRQAIIDILSTNDRVERVVLFGSRAMGTFTTTSDVDLALFGDHLTLTDHARLSQAIDELPIPQQVDVLLHRSIKNKNLIEHIKRHGVEWYKRDRGLGSDTVTFHESAKLIRQSVKPDNVGDMPYIGLEHIEEGTLRLTGIGTAKSITSTKFRFSKGDILFGKLRPYFRKVIRPDFDGVCSTDIWVVQAKQGINQGYLYYWMASNDFVNFATQGSEGTKMPRAKWDHVGRFQRLRVSEEEQRAIAHILGALDDKIELNRRMNRTLEAIARAIFRSWFLDFLPVRAKAEGRPTGLPDDIAALFPDSFEPACRSLGAGRDSELGEIPRGWEVKTIGDVVEFSYGKALKASDRKSGHVPVFGSNGQVGLHNEALVEGPGIIIGRKGNPGIVTWSYEDFFPIDTTFYVKKTGVVSSLNYLFYALKFQDLPSLSADSAVPGLNRNLAYMSKFLVPSEKVLKAFDGQIDPLFQTIYANEKEIKTLASLRDTLLPKLISGELHVPNAERFIEEEI